MSLVIRRNRSGKKGFALSVSTEIPISAEPFVEAKVGTRFISSP